MGLQKEKRRKRTNSKFAFLVAKCFQQTNISSSDIYSPVAKLTSIRIFLAICCHFQIKIYQLDICIAFLNGKIENNVFIRLPKGFEESNGGKKGGVLFND